MTRVFYSDHLLPYQEKIQHEHGQEIFWQIDGRDSVKFLVKVKELIEAPVQMLFMGQDPDKALLDI